MCKCDICNYWREFEGRLQHVPVEHQAFFQDLYEHMCTVENDYEYEKNIRPYQKRTYKSWPTEDKKSLIKILQEQIDAEETCTLCNHTYNDKTECKCTKWGLR